MPVLTAYRALVDAGQLTGDAEQEAAAQRLSALGQAIRRHQAGGFLGLGKGPFAPGIYLWGGVGRGKSMLMELFVRETSVRGLRKLHFHNFMAEIHAALKEEREGRARDPLARVIADLARRTRVLCLDELEIRDVTDAAIMARLFEALFREEVTVVTTSNRHPDDLYHDGPNRDQFLPFIALLKEKMDIIELDAERDYRLRRLKKSPTWYAPADRDHRAEFERLWDDLKAGAAEEPFKLTIASREWTLARSVGNVVRASFAELCEANHGVNDYLALAARAHTVFIEDIPRLTVDKRNVARRFVLLVDALYEARAKLVALAAVKPADLYPAGDGSFEFQRTVSRLEEMQSADYLTTHHA